MCSVSRGLAPSPPFLTAYTYFVPSYMYVTVFAYQCVLWYLSVSHSFPQVRGWNPTTHPPPGCCVGGLHHQQTFIVAPLSLSIQISYKEKKYQFWSQPYAVHPNLSYMCRNVSHSRVMRNCMRFVVFALEFFFLSWYFEESCDT